MRKINHLIWHCSATPEGKNYTVSDIRGWHVKGNGWSDIGYHGVVYLDGSFHPGRPIEKTGAHVKNHNTGSIGYCYVGGVDKSGKPKDTRTAAQKATMARLTREAKTKYGITKVSGHNEFANKACPSFDVQTDPTIQEAFKGTAAPRAMPAALDYEQIRRIQTMLKDLGYHEVGRADGAIGSRTRGAILAFRADNDLPLSAIIDDILLAALARAPAREVSFERAIGKPEGSRIKSASEAQIAIGGVGAVVASIKLMEPVFQQIEGISGALTSMSDSMVPLISSAEGTWPLLLLLGAAAAVFFAWRARKARIEDHRVGKTP